MPRADFKMSTLVIAWGKLSDTFEVPIVVDCCSILNNANILYVSVSLCLAVSFHFIIGLARSREREREREIYSVDKRENIKFYAFIFHS